MSCKAAGATPKVISFEDFIKCDDSSSKVDNLVPKRKSKIKNLTSLSQPANNGIVDEIMCNQDAILTPEKSKKAKAVFIKKNVTECKHSSTNSVHLIKKHKLSMKSKKKRALLQESDTDEVVYVGISKSKTKTKSSQQISPPIKKQRSNDEDVTIVSVTPSLNNKEYLLAPSISEAQWTEKYFPQSSRDLLAGGGCVAKLMTWLRSWKERIEVLLLEEEEEKKHCTSYEEDGDFRLTKEDAAEANDTLPNLFVLLGSRGSCKTATVYTCAREAGFKVLELSASSDRSSKAMVGRLREATQSHLVSHKEVTKPTNDCKGLKNFFQTSFKKKKCETPSNGACLILIDEVEAELECDKNFWNGVNYLAAVSKRPIILTSSSVTQHLESRCEQAILEPPSMEKVAKLLRKVARSEGIALSRDHCEQIIGACRHDVRQALLTLQFWKKKLAFNVRHPMAPSPVHALLWGLPPPSDGEFPLQMASFHLEQHHLVNEINGWPGTAGNDPLRITSHCAEGSSVGWADGDSEGELLSIAYNRKQIPYSAKCSAANQPDPRRGQSGVAESTAELKQMFDRFQISSLADRLRGEFAKEFVEHTWSGAFQSGTQDQHGDYVDVDCHTEALLMAELASLQAKAMETCEMVYHPLTCSPLQLYPGLVSTLRRKVSCVADVYEEILPALRSICRVEERRRAAKSRRFLHYLDEVGCDVTPSASLLLAQEYSFAS